MHTLTQYCEQLCSLLGRTVVTNAYGTEISMDEGAEAVVALLVTARRHGRKVMVVGNGGSAAIAAHLQNDLCKAVGVRALCFGETSLMTALANDHGYETAYELAVRQWAEDGDVLIAISSSGNSENILRAVQAAVESGCTVVTLSGFGADNRLRSLGAVNFHVPVAHYGLAESAHAVLTHFFTDIAQARLQDMSAQQASLRHTPPAAQGRLRLLRPLSAVARRAREAR